MSTRQTIRSTLSELIKTGFKTVFDYRPPQLFDDELPCASVYFDDGESERDFDLNVDTRARVMVEITTKEQGNIDAALDALAATVEQAVRNDPELGGVVNLIARIGFTYERDPESFTGSLTLTFTVTYDDED